nr:flagellar hook capping FlgD N-terminal domain-containing protein [Marivita hallyeonensis]
MSIGQTTTSSASRQSPSTDFETFLRMLTTQMQNQDPLSPMEADAFASQLATFSMVEQQTLTNQRLEDLVQGLSGRHLPDFAGLVGMSVSHSGPFKFNGTALEFETDTQGLSGREIVILDRQANIVATQVVGPDDVRITWDGKDAEGRFVNAGTYSAQVRIAATGEIMEDVSVTTKGTVEEVVIKDGDAVLLLENGSEVAESLVKRIR